MRWGRNFLKSAPPRHRPQVALALPTPGELRTLGLISSPRGVGQQLKIFCDDFFVAADPRLQYLVAPHLTIPWFNKPPKHNVAVPINKVEGRLGGANAVGGGVGVVNHPKRWVAKGFGAEGGLTRNEGGGDSVTTVPLQRSCAAEGGVGDVGDVHLGRNGMERGDAQIMPPPGVGKVPGEGEKGVVCWCTCSKMVGAHHVTVGGGGYGRG